MEEVPLPMRQSQKARRSQRHSRQGGPEISSAMERGRTFRGVPRVTIRPLLATENSSPLTRSQASSATHHQLLVVRQNNTLTQIIRVNEKSTRIGQSNKNSGLNYNRQPGKVKPSFRFFSIADDPVRPSLDPTQLASQR